jgi:molybdopterin molybdotransferase
VSQNFQPQTIAVALQTLADAISAVSESEFVGLHESGGRTLATSIHSPHDMPSMPLSAMDGYALSSTLLNKTDHGKPLPLQVLGKSLAGHVLEGEARADACIRIFTGAVVPTVHDTVVPQERVQSQDDGAVISIAQPSEFRAGANVRRPGEDLRRDAVALAAGQVIGAREIALLAAMGIAAVEVVRTVRVAVLSTGDEVVEIGRPVPRGRIHDANRPMLLQLIRECGAHAVDLGIVGDDPESLRQAIAHAASIADAVITSGGVSVGEADHTRATMESMGDIAFWKLAIKPGRPLAAGWVRGHAQRPRVPFFGLPGNPVAAFVTFKAIVAPCLQKLAGIHATERAPIRARLAHEARKTPGRTEYLRCSLRRGHDGEWEADIAASQGAASLKSLVDAQGLVVLPHDAGPMPAGTPVDVILLS